MNLITWVLEKYHDIRWQGQHKRCLCTYDPKKDAQLMSKYLKTPSEYCRKKLPFDEELDRFEKSITSWLRNFPSPRSKEWKSMWLNTLKECDAAIRNAKTRDEADRAQSIKDTFTYHKKIMEEKEQEHLAFLSRMCHCPQHRYSKNSG